MGKNCHKDHKEKSSGIFGMFKPLIYIVLIPTIVIAGVIFLTTRSQGTEAQNQEAAGVSNSTYEVDKNSFSFGTI